MSSRAVTLAIGLVLPILIAASLHVPSADASDPKPLPVARPGQPADPAAAAAAPVKATGLLDGEFKTTASGLKLRDVEPGSGATVAKEGDTVLTHYRGWLADGTPFDNSYDRGKPFPVRNVGRAGVIKGWNEGLLGMKKGGKRRLVIPPELAYGPSGRPPVIPPAATLVFDVEVVDITTPPPPPPPDVFPDLATLKLVTSESGLRWADLAAGGGPEIQAGSDTLMHYTGWLEDGTKFDSSKDRGDTFPVRGVGRASVIKGWNEGLIGMKEGGKRVLVIPPDLGYGAAGAGGAIPPNATLVFAVEAVKVMPPAAAPVRAP